MPERLREAPSRRRVVGAKQTLKSLKGDRAAVVYLARDAEKRITGPIEGLCRERGVEVIYVPTMDELGSTCGIEVGASAAALLRDEDEE